MNCNLNLNKMMIEMMAALSPGVLLDVFNPIAALFSGTAGIFTLIHVIIWLVFTVEIVQSSKGLVKKVFWFLMLLCFPLGGLILYLLFGREARRVYTNNAF